MAGEDRTREDRARARRSLQTQEPQDYGLLKGVAAAAAGAAFLRYQPGGKMVTRALGRSYKFLKEVNKHIDEKIGKDIEDWSLRDWQGLYRERNALWDNAKKAADRVRLNPNQGSLAHFVQGIETSLSAATTSQSGNALSISRMARQSWRQDVLAKQMRDEVSAHLGLSKNDQRKFESFINQVARSPQERNANENLMRRMKFEGAQAVHANNILKVMQMRAHDAATGADLAAQDYMRNIDKSLTKIKEDAYSLESLERNMGTLTLQDRMLANLGQGRKLTVGDILKDPSKIEDHTIVKADGSTQSMIDWMKDYESKMATRSAEEQERWHNITVDAENLRITNSGQVYSKEAGRGFYKDLLTFAAGTMPGQLFKLRDLQNKDTISAFQWFDKTMRNPILQAKLEKMGDADNYHYRVGKDIYSIDEQGNSKLVLENVKMVSGRTGFYHGNLEAMSGIAKMKESDNAILRYFDIFQDREHYSGSEIKDLASRFGPNRRSEELEGLLRDPNWDQLQDYRRATTDILVNGDNASQWSKDYLYQYGDILRKASQTLQNNTYKIEGTLLDQLKKNANGESRKFFELLNQDTTTIEEALLSETAGYAIPGQKKFLNPRLQKLMDDLVNDPNKTRNSYELVTDPSRLYISTEETAALQGALGNKTYYYEDILRKELGKEALLRQGYTPTGTGLQPVNYDAVNDLLSSLVTTDKVNMNALREIDKLAQTAIFEQRTNITGNVRKNIDELLLQTTTANELLQGSSRTAKSFQTAYDKVMADEIGWFEASSIGDNTPGVGGLDEFVFVNNVTTPLDIIGSINKSIKANSLDPLKNTSSSFVNQFLAGRENMEDVSTLTLAPYFMLKRLSDEVNKVGLGFSTESMGSTSDLASAIFFKRVLPIGLGLTAFDFTDDVSREVTGQSLSGAFVNGIANVDLAGRKVLSGLGMDEWLKEEKSINPIWQYWFEKDEYQSYEERSDYYRRGYDPVRRNAWYNVCHAA